MEMSGRNGSPPPLQRSLSSGAIDCTVSYVEVADIFEFDIEIVCIAALYIIGRYLAALERIAAILSPLQRIIIIVVLS